MPSLGSRASALAERLDAVRAVDPVIEPVHRGVERVLPQGRAKDALHGVWLGHPLHPLLTDLPIGFWTSAFVLDLFGGRRSEPAADAMVALGVVSAVPTMAAGLADWSELDAPERRSGLVHGVANTVATALYAASFLRRRVGRRGAGVMLGLVGAMAATAGGYLGGHLTFRRGVGANHATGAPTGTDARPLQLDGQARPHAVTRGSLDGAPLAVADAGSGPAALVRPLQSPWRSAR